MNASEKMPFKIDSAARRLLRKDERYRNNAQLLVAAVAKEFEGALRPGAVDDIVLKVWARSLPYPWCMHPDKCRGRGSCPRDPNCGD